MTTSNQQNQSNTNCESVELSAELKEWCSPKLRTLEISSNTQGGAAGNTFESTLSFILS